MFDRLGDEARLRHILDAIAEIKNYSDGLDFQAFWDNSLVKSGCAYQFGVIGEACSHLTTELRAENSGMPWRQLIGLRNIIMHQYFSVDYPIIWDIIQNELAFFETEFRAILADIEK